MERSLKRTEESVTKDIIKWLTTRGWDIVCYDFPQSGTGRAIHSSESKSKTKGIIIPDIVAIKDGVVVVFEDKDRFVLKDFNKINMLKETTEYNDGWNQLLSGRAYSTIYFGIGMPYSVSNVKKSLEYLELVDYVAFLEDDGGIIFYGDKKDCFS